MTAILNQTEIAALYGVHRATVARWIDAGDFPPATVPHNRLMCWAAEDVTLKAVVAWRDANQVVRLTAQAVAARYGVSRSAIPALRRANMLPPPTAGVSRWLATDLDQWDATLRKEATK